MIRQCCYCFSIFNPETEEWEAHDKREMGTHGACPPCLEIAFYRIRVNNGTIAICDDCEGEKLGFCGICPYKEEKEN